LDLLIQILALASVFLPLLALTGYIGYRLALRSRLSMEAHRRQHPLWQVSEVEERFFDSSTIEVDWQGIAPASYVGISLTDDQVKLLSGAPSGSKVTVKYRSAADWQREGTGADRPPPGLYFYITGPGIMPHAQNVVGIYQNADSTAGLYLKDIMLSDSLPEGAAGRMLVRMARAGVELGIKELRLLGAGGRSWPSMLGAERWKGYTAWPGYGFDMPLHQLTKGIVGQFPHHPPGLGSCYTVGDVLARPDGGLFWRIVGDGWFMTFDLTSKDTSSVRTLLAKVQRKGA
jgi:hypothetical protein